MQQFDEQKKREWLFTPVFFGMEVLRFDDQKEMKANEEKKQKEIEKKAWLFIWVFFVIDVPQCGNFMSKKHGVLTIHKRKRS